MKQFSYINYLQKIIIVCKYLDKTITSEFLTIIYEFYLYIILISFVVIIHRNS